MKQKSRPEKQPAEETIKDARRAARRHFSAEEEIRIVLEELRVDPGAPTIQTSGKLLGAKGAGEKGPI
jgi:CHAD domain-containing protein